MDNHSRRSIGGDRLDRTGEFPTNGEGSGARAEPENKRRRVEDDAHEVANGDMNLTLTLGLSSSAEKTPPQPVEERPPPQPPRAVIWVPPAVARPLRIGPTMVQHQPPNVVNGMVNASASNVAPGHNTQIGALRNHHLVHGLSVGPRPLDEAVTYGRPEMASARPSRGRRRATHSVSGRKSPTVVPPYTWATERRATVHPLQALAARGITVISGDMQCKRCEQPSRLEYNLTQQFARIADFVNSNRDKMRDRAPIRWLNPALPRCPSCEHENSLKPVIAEKKRNINWLFLLLGEMLGCCTLEQLKYFCKHTGNHRTGAKDRVLYLAYLALCKQLDPTGPFNR